MKNNFSKTVPVCCLLVAAILAAATGTVAAQSLTLAQTVPMTHGSIWCIPVFDGDNIVVSAETPGTGIRLAKHDLAMNQTGAAILVADANDTANHDGIADHKHIFQNDHHYIAFSISGGGSGGYLYLLKLDRALQRVALATVVSNDPPTNDMLMVGDGTNVYVGKFLPGTGHRIYAYDADLNFLGNKQIGGGQNRHANGAAAIYADGLFHVVAPDTLAPGQNDVYGHLTFGREWNCVSNKTAILSDPGALSIVSGLSRDPASRSYILTYARAPDDGGGPIHAAIYDSGWRLLSNGPIVAGARQRPHSAIVGDRLYLGYDGEGLAVSVFAISNAAVGPVITANGSTNPVTIGSADTLDVSLQLYPGEYAGPVAP